MKIACDFDGTLAKNFIKDGDEYDPSLVGDPIPAMVERVRRWLVEGHEVEIFTARVCPRRNERQREMAMEAIEGFCLEQFGRKLPVTCVKSFEFDVFYDDKAVQVEENTGRLIGMEEDEDEQDDPMGSFLK